MTVFERLLDIMSGTPRTNSAPGHGRRWVRTLVAPVTIGALVATWIAPPTIRGQSARERIFPTAEAAVQALFGSVKAGNLDELFAIFGTDGRELVASSDTATARRNREVFAVAVREHWELVDEGPSRKTLVVGNERWPFPVPLVKDAAGWRFDAAAGKEEILTRRIGANELAVIQTCRAYVTAQQRYAQQGHDGKAAGLYAKAFRSDPGRQNGLYWPTSGSQKPSPLGELIAEAATEGRAAGRPGDKPSPFQGYYYRILTAQGAAAPGGAMNYVVNGEMSRGFALVAWPAQYNVTGVMTFIVSADGFVREKDLGASADSIARTMTQYNPAAGWHRVQ
jgi:Protein of unknown function (DUF2950)